MWYETINGGSWQVSMLVAALMTLLALNEVFGDARPFYVGLWSGAAFLSRYDLLLVCPLYFLLLLARHPSEQAVSSGLPRTAYRYALGVLPAIAIYIWFNEARYGTWKDLGLIYYNPANGNTALATPPTLFAWRYFPGNFFTLFYMAPRLDATFPYIHPLPGGQSILTTSPAFLLALRAKLWERRNTDAMSDVPSESKSGGTVLRHAGMRPRSRGCHISDGGLIALMALLSALPVLFYVGNGMTQFGARHFVEVFPF